MPSVPKCLLEQLELLECLVLLFEAIPLMRDHDVFIELVKIVLRPSVHVVFRSAIGQRLQLWMVRLFPEVPIRIELSLSALYLVPIAFGKVHIDLNINHPLPRS